MNLRTLLLIVFLLVIPLPLALIFGMFTDYSEPGNQRYLRYHPGYYYHYWSSPRTSYHRTTGAGTSGTGLTGTRTSGTTFRGGGPAFGK